MLKIERPIIFFDLEATGVNVYNDRVVQIAAIKYLPKGKKTEHEWLINPKMPIPKEALAIHGITDEMVADKPTFGDIAQELITLFSGADLGGYNIKNYDIPMLQNEFTRIDLPFEIDNVNIVDAYTIYTQKESRNLQAAYEKYVGGKFEDAHNAMADIRASIKVLEGQLKYYNDLPDTARGLHEFCFPYDPDSYDSEGKLRYKNGELAINFGKNKGRALKELALDDESYLRWILNGSFSEKVKDAVRDVLH